MFDSCSILPATVGLRDPVDGAEDDYEDSGHEGEAHQVHPVHHQQGVAAVQRLNQYSGDFSCTINKGPFRTFGLV